MIFTCPSPDLIDAKCTYRHASWGLLNQPSPDLNKHLDPKIWEGTIVCILWRFGNLKMTTLGTLAIQYLRKHRQSLVKIAFGNFTPLFISW